MNLLARILLFVGAIPMMGFAAMDTIFAMDLFGFGMGPQVTGAIAILTGIFALFLAIRPCSTRRAAVMGLAGLVLVLRLYRLTGAMRAFSWDVGGWLIFLLLLGLPILIILAAIFATPANCSLPARSANDNSGST